MSLEKEKKLLFFSFILHTFAFNLNSFNRAYFSKSVELKDSGFCSGRYSLIVLGEFVWEQYFVIYEN